MRRAELSSAIDCLSYQLSQISCITKWRRRRCGPSFKSQFDWLVAAPHKNGVLACSQLLLLLLVMWMTGQWSSLLVARDFKFLSRLIWWFEVWLKVTPASAVLVSWNTYNLDIRNFLSENKNKIEIELSKSVGRQSRAGLCQVVVLVRRSSIPRSQSWQF